jgi:hypothetical protein
LEHGGAQVALSDVHVGRDGWLYFIGGANQVLRYYRDPTYFTAAHVDAWVRLIASRRKRAGTLGASYAQIITPEKLSACPEHYDGPELLIAPPSRSIPEAWARAHGAPSPLVSLEAAFESARAAGEAIYYKTDTHWTWAGAHAAYLALCAQVDAAPRLDLPDRPGIVAELVLDLGGKLDPPVKEALLMRANLRDARRVDANWLVLFKEREGLLNEGGLHVGCSVVFRNESAEDRRTIMLFGDSFSDYRDGLLTTMLAETFFETHFVWSSSIDWPHVERVRPDVLVTELSERFMVAVPQDSSNVNKLALRRVRAFDPPLAAIE